MTGPLRALRRLRCHRWRDRVRASELAARPPKPRLQPRPCNPLRFNGSWIDLDTGAPDPWAVRSAAFPDRPGVIQRGGQP